MKRAWHGVLGYLLFLLLLLAFCLGTITAIGYLMTSLVTRLL